MSLLLAFHAEVQGEVDAAYRWYECERPGLGDELLTRLREQLDLIQQRPETYGVLRRKTRGALLKQFPYVVDFRIAVDRIDVLAVQHGRRHSRAWQSRT